MAQQLAWGRARALVFRESLDSIHDDRSIALRALHPAPFAARQVMRHFADPIRLDVESLEVVYNDVGRRALAQDAAVAEARRMRGERRQSIVRLFERYAVLVAHH